MAVKVGSARIDENGKAIGGKAGDQTGNECSTQNWYKHSKGWRVIRAKDPAVRAKLAKAMSAACANNHIGYDQGERNTLYNLAAKVGFDVSKVTQNCETDCSALVRVCVAYAAGITNLPSGFRTTNMCKYLLDTGAFVEMIGTEYTDKSNKLCAGDILCTKTQGHTVIVLNDGANADKSAIGTTSSTGSSSATMLQIQRMLLLFDAGCLPKYGADGEYGSETASALKAFQEAYNMPVTGEADKNTVDVLEAVTSAYKIIITGATVNVRAAAGLDKTILTIVRKNDIITYNRTELVSGVSWYHTAKGWISGKFAREYKNG